jgi:hypothetical protein
MDGIFKLFGDDYLSVRMAQTYDNTIDNKLASTDPSFLLVNWERRSEKGFTYNLLYSFSGEQFNPGIGFVQRPGIQGFSGNLKYGWLPGDKSRFLNYGAYIRSTRYTRLEDGKMESMTIEPGWSIFTKKGYGTDLSVTYQEEGVLNDFAITDSISVKAGNYTYTSLRDNIFTPMSLPVSGMLMINAGQFYDGRQFGIAMMPMVNISSSIQLSGSYMFSLLSFPDRETNNKLNIHSANIRVLYMFNTKLSASVLVQYVSTMDDLIANFRLRFNPKEGNDFYMVYNEYRGVANGNEIPALPAYYNRTIMLKYTYTFRI